MRKLKNHYTNTPIINPFAKIPPLGEYYSLLLDCNIVPLDGVRSCLVLDHKLINCVTLEPYFFTETYYCDGSNPKTNDFFDYLKREGITYELEEQLIGTREKLTISLDYLGGIEYPIVGKRELIAKSPRLKDMVDYSDIDDYDLDF